MQIISKDDKARLVYEAREAELRDQLTRLKSAEKMIKRGDSVEDIIELTELTKEIVLELKRKHQH